MIKISNITGSLFDGILKLSISPDSFNNLIAKFKFSFAMFLSISPSAFENFSVGKKKDPFPVLEAIQVFSFVPVSVGPRENSKAFDESMLPLPIVLTVIDIGEDSVAMKVAVGEFAFVDARIADIMAKAGLDTMEELTFIIGTVLKLFLALAVGHVVLPLPVILVALERVVVNAHSIRFIVFYFAFIHAPVVVAVAPLAVGDAF